MEPILKSHFNRFKSSFSIETNEESNKEANAFEMFVNYVLFSRDDPDVFTGRSDLIDFVCVGGGNDTGIDGIGILVNDRLVKDIEEVQDIVSSSKKVKIKFVFIQSKMRPRFESSELQTFGTGVKMFFSEGYVPENNKIVEYRTIKDFIYNDETVISKLYENPSLYLYYVASGNEPDDAHFSGSLKWLKTELVENFYFENVDVSIIGGKSLIKYCRELENKFEIQINIKDIFPLIVDSMTQVKKAYAFTCAASEFLKILQKEDGSMRRALFNDNVRDYLGDRGPVNKEIEATIENDPEMFLLCNNGITIVCSDFEQVRDKLVKIENPQIVNGCQTSNSIFRHSTNQNLAKLQLLVRLISTEDINVSNKIVRGTNKQNQVLDEAFETTLPFHQETLEPFFLSYMNPDVKLYYERRSKQYNNDPNINRTEVVNLRILTQSFVGVFLDSPHMAHRHEAKLLEAFAGDDESRKIFREEHSPYPYYICALVWYLFERAFREYKIDKRYKTYVAHLFLITKFCVGEFPPANLSPSKRLDAYCKKFLELLRFENFKSRINSIIDTFDEAERNWTQSRSRHAIKDNKDFTELLIRQSRRRFITKDEEPREEEIVSTEKYEGTVLRIIQKHGLWFGFIDRGIDFENVYFDSRGYDGDEEDLFPGTRLVFEIGKSDRGYFAKNVDIAD